MEGGQQVLWGISEGQGTGTDKGHKITLFSEGSPVYNQSTAYDQEDSIAPTATATTTTTRHIIDLLDALYQPRSRPG